MYTGTMSKDGVTYDYMVVQTDSAASAQAYMPTMVTYAEGVGFTGSTQSNGSWTGSMTDTSTGNPMAANISVSGTAVLVVLGE
jgi:hypothetical protein